MIDTQAKGRVSNSAANSLPSASNSAAGELGRILPKPLISRRFSTPRGCFLEAERGFLPDIREMRRRQPWQGLDPAVRFPRLRSSRLVSVTP